jgi:hypothetical protein
MDGRTLLACSSKDYFKQLHYLEPVKKLSRLILQQIKKIWGAAGARAGGQARSAAARGRVIVTANAS